MDLASGYFLTSILILPFVRHNLENPHGLFENDLTGLPSLSNDKGRLLSSPNITNAPDSIEVEASNKDYVFENGSENDFSVSQNQTSDNFLSDINGVNFKDEILYSFISKKVRETHDLLSQINHDESNPIEYDYFKSSLWKILDEIHYKTHSLDGKKLNKFRLFFGDNLRNLFNQSFLFSEALSKSQGNSVDYEILQNLYNSATISKTRLGRFLDQFFFDGLLKTEISRTGLNNKKIIDFVVNSGNEEIKILDISHSYDLTLDKSFIVEDGDFSRLNQIASKFPSLISKKLEELPIDYLLNQISVGRPYFNFDKIYRHEDVFIAKINPEQLVEFESTPISSGEASRHMAILGSCVFAMNNPQRMYYLATKARMRSNPDIIKKIGFRPIDPIYVMASALKTDKKDCSATTALVNNKGEIIFEFKVGYQTFNEKLFQRIFKNHFKNTSKSLFSPYRNIFSYQNIEINGGKLTAILPKFDPSDCVGHFDNYPILPVGILAYTTIHTLKNLLDKITNKQNLFYCLTSATMDVYAPTLIDEEAKLEIFYKGNKGNEYSFYWQLKDLSNNILNEMEISFTTTYQINNYV